jgi:hypothetical protein
LLLENLDLLLFQVDPVIVRINLNYISIENVKHTSEPGNSTVPG